MMALKKAIIALAISIVFLLACHDVEILTTIQPDGSCMRIISVEGDSSGIPLTAYPIFVDSTWQMTKTEKEDEEGKYIYIIQKNFGSVAELNNTYAGLSDSVLLIRPTVKLTRRFRWFHTFYRYEEVYRNQSLWLTGGDSLAIQRVEQMIAEQDSSQSSFDIVEELIYEQLFRTLERGAEELKNPELSVRMIRAKKEQLRQALDEANFDLEDFTNSALKTCEQVYKTKAVWQLREAVEEYVQKIERYFNFIERSIGETYVNRVVMPGVIIATNAATIQGHQVSWEVESDDFEIKDYPMWVESRRINAFPTILTTLFLIGCIAGIYLLTGHDGKRNKKHRVIDRWLSLTFIVVGAGLFLFFGWLTISFWDFAFLPIQLIPLKEKLFMFFLTVVGFVLFWVGIFHYRRWRSDQGG